MLDGKKGLAQRIVYGAFDQVAENPVRKQSSFQQALENVMPMLEVKARRVGGSNYQVPIEVRPERRQTLALRWIVNAARARSEAHDRIVWQLNCWILISKGAAFRRKERMHRMAKPTVLLPITMVELTEDRNGSGRLLQD